MLKTSSLPLLLLAAPFSSYTTVPVVFVGAMEIKDATRVSISNPHDGKSWFPNVDEVNDQGAGRGLRGPGKSCQDLFPHCSNCSSGGCRVCVNGHELDNNGQCVKSCEISKCATCHPGGETCKACRDETDEGGYPYELYNGICVLAVNFDDLETPTNLYADVPDGYSGFNWDDVHYGAVELYTDFTNSGWAEITGSSPHMVFNSYGDPASFTSVEDDVTFSLISIQMTPAVNQDLEVAIEGFDANGNLIGEMSVTLSSPLVTEAVEFGESFQGLASVTITSKGGSTFTDFGYYSEQVVFDDILVVV